MPNALDRSGEFAKVTVSSDSAEGASSAPKAPCSADQHREGLCQSSDRRGDREADEAHDERPLAPEQITELAAQQQQAAECQRVCGHDPLPAVG
jgi:hypothetical protein